MDPHLRLLCVCSGPAFEHTYPNGARIHNVVAVYLALGATGALRPDPQEGLEVRYFPVDGLPEISPASHRMLLEGLEAKRRATNQTIIETSRTATHPPDCPMSLPENG